MGVKIINEDTIELSILILLEQEYLELQQSILDEDPLESFMELFNYMDADINNVEKEFDGDMYTGYQVAIYDNDSSLEFIKLLEVDIQNGNEVYTLIANLEDLFTGFDTILRTEGLSLDELNSRTIKHMERHGIEMTMSFTMPYDIAKASSGDIEGNTVTINLFDLIMEDEDEITIVAIENGAISADTMLYIAGGISLIAAGAIAAIIIHNKKKQILPSSISNETITNNTTQKNTKEVDNNIDEVTNKSEE
jgi:hypothetical protein